MHHYTTFELQLSDWIRMVFFRPFSVKIGVPISLLYTLMMKLAEGDSFIQDEEDNNPLFFPVRPFEGTFGFDIILD